MPTTLKHLIIITLSTLSVTLLIWLPFLLQLNNFYGLNFSEGFGSIYRNYDGLNYVVIAKSFYNPTLIGQLPQSLPTEYFPAHFPGFPALIAVFAPILGYLKSMLFVSVGFTIASAYVFYFLVKDFKLVSNPLWLSILFLFLPARWLIVHSVGSPEPVFIFFLILSVYYFLKLEKEKLSKYLWLTTIFASLALLIRPPGVLIFVALAINLAIKEYKKGGLLKTLLVPINYYQLLLGPLTLVAIFGLFYFRMGDFWAYFHSGDNIHLGFPPFQVFNQGQYWVGDIWLEDIVYILLIGFAGGVRLVREKILLPGIIVLTYLTATSFVAHRDIARYCLPIFPFVLIAYEKALSSKEFKIVFAIIVLGIYLYAQNFLIQNTAPVGNLELFN